MSLTFDEASHIYHYNGELVPGVTSILAPLSNFSFVEPDVLASACAFGTAVHLACELSDRGTLDEDALDPALAPYLEGWKRYCVDHSAEWERIEAWVYHPTHKYAGTLDRYGKVNGKSCVVDIKTSAVLYPSVGPQLAAYKNAIEGAPPTTARMAVQLMGDGNYVAKTYNDRDDWPLFLSLLTLKQWCGRHSITPNFRKPS